MALSEMADRLTILKLKVERLPQDNTISTQYGLFIAEVDKIIQRFDQEMQDALQKEIGFLYNCNSKIWRLEFDIRNGKLGKHDLEEIGRRAIAIREINAERLSCKNRISELTENLIMKDIKIDHASE